MSPLSTMLGLLLAAGGADTVLARYRGGVVTQQDLEGWREYRGGAGQPKVELVEDLVVARALAADVATMSPDAVQLVRHHARGRIAKELLWEDVRTRNTPSEREVRAAFDADPARFHEPQLFRLQNILRRVPAKASEADRLRLRKEMEGLRARIVGGEDFAAIASKHSDSQTAPMGGSVGFVSLDRLAPSVREAVAGLAAGGLSPLIETPDGFTLLRCVDVLPGKRPGFGEVRERIGRELLRDRFQAAWGALTRRWTERLGPTFDPDAVTPDASASTTVATFREGAARHPVSLEDYRRFLGERPLPDGGHAEMLRERVLMEGWLQEARDLLNDPRHRGRIDSALLDAEARLVEEKALEGRVQPPSEAELRQAYGGKADRFRSEDRLRLRALRVPIDAKLPRALYDRVSAWGERAARAEASLEQVAAELRPYAEMQDWGWMTRDQAWLKGPGTERALQGLRPGRATPAFQEGNALFIVSLEAQEEGRPLTYAEAVPQIRASLLGARRRQARQQLRREILDAQAIVLQ